MGFGNILIALGIFLLVVFFHEGGHFLVAKASGIRVNEFSVGMGPKIWQREKGETLYTLRALPLGGYCAMEGEDEASDAPDSFEKALPGRRFLTILAGPLMNLVIAVLCFILFTGLSGKPVPIIETIAPGSPLAELDVEPEDRIVSIDGQEITSFEEIAPMLQGTSGGVVDLGLQRGDHNFSVSVRPTQIDGMYRLLFTAKTVFDPLYAVSHGIQMTGELFLQLFSVLGRLLTGRLSFDAVSGPVGVVTSIGRAAQEGARALVMWTGYISLNLAFFNLLPIPALDGSKLLLILIEKLRGKPIRKEIEERITMIGFFCLLGLILLVSIHDIMRLF